MIDPIQYTTANSSIFQSIADDASHTERLSSPAVAGAMEVEAPVFWSVRNASSALSTGHSNLRFFRHSMMSVGVSAKSRLSSVSVPN